MISIVLPVYNGEKYLSQAIDSIISQSYSNWELIIVNDCSTDSTGEIIKKYQVKDSRIKIIENAVNLKLPRSLNVGFESAMGEYFTWTSDDNILHAEALEKMAAFLDNEPEVGLVYTDMNYIDEAGRIISSNVHSCHKINLCNCVGASFMYRRSVAEITGGYDSAKTLVEDYDYWIRIFSKYKIARIPEILYDYRFHNQSMTSTRENEIQTKVAELKMEYFDLLTKDLSDDEYEAFCMGILLNNIEFADFLCEKKHNGISFNASMQRMMHIEPGKQFIIVGSGTIGEKVLEILGAENVFCYADNYKAGQKKGNKSIISVNQITAMQEEYNIIIAVGYMNAIEIMKQLNQNGIKQYAVYQLVKEKISK